MPLPPPGIHRSNPLIVHGVDSAAFVVITDTLINNNKPPPQ